MLSKTLKTLVVALPLVATAPGAFADTFAGKLNGYGCAHGGKTCPTDRLDPHVALEPDFVLQQADGGYLFLTNVPRDTKVRYALSTVQITGDLNPKYQAVMVDEFRVQKGNGFEKVWSLADEQAERDYLYNQDWFHHN